MTTICTPSAYQACQAKRAYVIEELTFLLSMGESYHQAALALGYRPDSLARQLQRWGRADLIGGWWA